jgi:hypothetical protein
MKSKTRFFLLVLPFFLLGNFVQAQRGFFMLTGSRSIEVPFDFTNNFIIIHLIINNTLPLNFIFDTGAGQTILTKKEITDVLGIRYQRTFKVMGSDLTKPLTAYLCRGIKLEIPEKIIAPQEDVLVLEEDCFQFEEYIGMSIHGILSANAFSRYLVKINYDRRVITLYEREGFNKKELKGFEKFDMEVIREKPYYFTTLQMTKDSIARVKLLLDTGAGMPLLLFTDTDPLLKPPANAIASNIGMGLGGNIEGFIGRIASVGLGRFDEKNVITYFQQLDTALYDAESTSSRNGVIGNGMLLRFTVVLDYYEKRVWLKPGKQYKSEYTYDRSGLSIISSGTNMNIYIIQDVIPNSPAMNVDIRKGDRIVKIGRKPAFMVTLTFILKKLQGKPGKKVRVTIERDEERLIKYIVLRDLL